MTKPTTEQQRDTIATMLNDPANVGFVRGTLAPSYFTDSNLAKIAETILAIDDRGETVTTYAVKRDTGDAACAEIIDELAATPLAQSDDAGRPARLLEPPQPYPLREVFPPAIADYIDEHCRAKSIDHSAMATLVLPYLATVIGNSRVVRIQPGWEAWAIVWGGVLARSGQAKSPARRAAEAGIRRIEREQQAAHLAAMDEYERRLAEWKASKSKDNKPVEPVCERIITGDVTIEAVAMLLQANPKGIGVSNDELGGWLASFDAHKNGAGDRDRWLSLYNGDVLRVDRKVSASALVLNACASVAGTIQPSRFRELIGHSEIGSGLAARFLLAMPTPKPKRNSRGGINPSVQAPYESVFTMLHALEPDWGEDGQPSPRVLPLTADAERCFLDWTDVHNPDVLAAPEDGTAEAYAKLEEMPARLALILTLIDNPSATEIGVEAVKRGIILTEWHKAEAARVYAWLGGAEHSPLLDHIRTLGGDAATRELLRAGPFVGKTKAELLAELDRLEQAGAGKRYFADGRTERFRLTG